MIEDMADKHTHALRETAKVFSGLIIADIIVGVWLGYGHYVSVVWGIPLTDQFLYSWLMLDFVILVLLIHYGWHIELPPARAKRAMLITIGVLLLAVCSLHVLRIFYGLDLVIGGVALPLWLSVVGATVTGFLGYSSIHFAVRK